MRSIFIDTITLFKIIDIPIYIFKTLFTTIFQFQHITITFSVF